MLRYTSLQYITLRLVQYLRIPSHAVVYCALVSVCCRTVVKFLALRRRVEVAIPLMITFIVLNVTENVLRNSSIAQTCEEGGWSIVSSYFRSRED